MRNPLLSRRLLTALVLAVASPQKILDVRASKSVNRQPIEEQFDPNQSISCSGAGFSDAVGIKAGFPAAQYTCLGINLAFRVRQRRPELSAFFPETDMSVLLFRDKYKKGPSSSLSSSPMSSRFKFTRPPKPLTAVSGVESLKAGDEATMIDLVVVVTNGAQMFPALLGDDEYVTEGKQKEKKAQGGGNGVNNGGGLLSWCRHLRHLRSITIIADRLELGSMVGSMRRRASEYEKVPPIHFVDLGYFARTYDSKSSRLVNGSNVSNESSDHLSHQTLGFKPPLAGVIGELGSLQTSDSSPGNNQEATPTTSVGEEVDWEPWCQAASSECEELVKLHVFDLKYLLNDVVVIDPFASLVADSELVLPNRSAFYLNTIPAVLKKYQLEKHQLERTDKAANHAAALWERYKEEPKMAVMKERFARSPIAEAKALAKFLAAMESAGGGANSGSEENSEVGRGRQRFRVQGETRQQLKLWEHYKESKHKVFSTPNAEADARSLFLSTLNIAQKVNFAAHPLSSSSSALDAHPDSSSAALPALRGVIDNRISGYLAASAGMTSSSIDGPGTDLDQSQRSNDVNNQEQEEEQHIHDLVCGRRNTVGYVNAFLHGGKSLKSYRGGSVCGGPLDLFSASGSRSYSPQRQEKQLFQSTNNNKVSCPGLDGRKHEGLGFMVFQKELMLQLHLALKASWNATSVWDAHNQCCRLRDATTTTPPTMMHSSSSLSASSGPQSRSSRYGHQDHPDHHRRRALLGSWKKQRQPPPLKQKKQVAMRASTVCGKERGSLRRERGKFLGRREEVVVPSAFELYYSFVAHCDSHRRKKRVLDLEMAGSGVDLEIFAGDCTHQELETCREKGNVLLKSCPPAAQRQRHPARFGSCRSMREVAAAAATGAGSVA